MNLILAEQWETFRHPTDLLRLFLYAPEHVNPEKLDQYVDWLWKDLRSTTKEWLLEDRSSEFETRTIWSAESIERDLRANRIDEVEAKRRRRLGIALTAEHGSDLVCTAKIVDDACDKIWGRKTDVDATIEVRYRAEQAAQLREIVGNNPFLSMD